MILNSYSRNKIYSIHSWVKTSLMAEIFESLCVTIFLALVPINRRKYVTIKSYIEFSNVKWMCISILLKNSIYLIGNMYLLVDSLGICGFTWSLQLCCGGLGTFVPQIGRSWACGSSGTATSLRFLHGAGCADRARGRQLATWLESSLEGSHVGEAELDVPTVTYYWFSLFIEDPLRDVRKLMV